MTIGIYRITNTINSKAYVGQSWDIEKRWKSYGNMPHKAQVKLYKAFAKYGSGAFQFDILEELPPYGTQDDLNALEIAWIAKLNCVHDGYNCKYGGLGGKCSDETKRKISAAVIGGKGNTVHHATGSNHGNWNGGQIVQGKFVYIRNSEHPLSHKGYVKRAIIVAEEKLGRSLLPNERVFHVDMVKTNDDPLNLEILDVNAYRKRTSNHPPRRHAEVRTCVVCGDPVTRPRFRYSPDRTTCNLPKSCRTHLSKKL